MVSNRFTLLELKGLLMYCRCAIIGMASSIIVEIVVLYIVGALLLEYKCKCCRCTIIRI